MTTWDPAYHLALLRRIARARGGALLSRAYVNDATKLHFRCAAGHEWWLDPGHVKQGRWCAKCNRARNIQRQKAPAIARLRRLVARRGGAILSEYVNSQTKLRYRCREGHVWEAIPNSILRGSWCPVCAERLRERRRKELQLPAYRRLLRIVKRRGGKVLPPGYANYRVRLRLRCARGHTWEARPDGLDAGAWCPRCKEESYLAELRARAEKWGGVCLSRSYRNNRDRMRWRCAQGHHFQKSAASVLAGGWCGRCRGPGEGNIERMRQVARERGGVCLSTKYVDAETHLRWRCDQGHEWSSIPGSIVQGTWCPVCRLRDGHSLARLSIAIMRQTAAELGGTCLSKRYHGAKVPLRWRCARGHVWTTYPFLVRQGHWCPKCAHTVRGTLDGMHVLAAERGGRCVSRTWNDHRQALRFECRQGHRFSALAGAIKTGVWCPQCRGGGRARRRA